MVHDDIPSVGTTALAFYVGVGSRDEQPPEWGMAHLLEHLVFKGAAEHDHRAIARQMDRLGSDINAFTTRDYTCFHARVLDSEAVLAYQLLVEMVMQPWLRDADLDREKNVVREEMRESLDDPDEVVDTLITGALYRDQAYTHDILGTPRSLEGVDGAALRRFFQTHYQPPNMVLALSGGAVDHVIERAAQDFAGPGSRSRLPRRRSIPALRLTVEQRREDWEQVRLALAVPAPGRYDAGYASALMLASLMGGQNTSRLWQRLREQDGLVYTVGTQYAPETGFGDMTTYLGLGPDHVDEALRALAEEVEVLAIQGPDHEDLEHTCTYLNTVLVMNQETPDARVMRLGRYALDGRLAPDLPLLGKELRSVTPAEVRQQVAAWLPGAPLAAAAAGPLDQDLSLLWARGKGAS